MKVYSCSQMRKIEENAFLSGMSYATMMENAGKACFEKIKDTVDLSSETITVLCGNGNNGGDGFVIARYLSEFNYKVNVILVLGAPKTETADIAFSKLDKSVLRVIDFKDFNIDTLKTCDIIIDCIFGIGFRGPLRGNVLEIARMLNSLDKTVVSVDIPSGLEGDTVNTVSEYIKADFTLAVACKKPVHVLKTTKNICGEVQVVDIGFNKDCYNLEDDCAFEIADEDFVKDSLIPRKSDSNKGTYGKLLCVCGSKNMQGAAVLCANAAVRCGTGLITCAFPEKAYGAIAAKLTEPLMLPLPDDENGFLAESAVSIICKKLETASAAVIGCGLGVTDGTEKVLRSVLKSAKCPIVIDADGLNILSENIDILKTVDVPLVLTPHPGEMARLLGRTIAEIQSDRISACKELSQRTNAVVLLKGSNTVIAFKDKVYINPTGNAGMAKGGCGDVLSGMIGSFLAQGVNPLHAAVCGAYLHGLCGDEVAKKYSQTGMTPSMMIDYLPQLFSNFENKAD